MLLEELGPIFKYLNLVLNYFNFSYITQAWKLYLEEHIAK
jgi:hypothetical protein